MGKDLVPSPREPDEPGVKSACPRERSHTTGTGETRPLLPEIFCPVQAPGERIDRKPLSFWWLHSLEEKSNRLFCGYSTSSPSNPVNVSSSTSHFFRIAKMVFDRKPARTSCRKIRAACF
jgi:hypothetical protein